MIMATTVAAADVRASIQNTARRHNTVITGIGIARISWIFLDLTSIGTLISFAAVRRRLDFVRSPRTARSVCRAPVICLAGILSCLTLLSTFGLQLVADLHLDGGRIRVLATAIARSCIAIAGFNGGLALAPESVFSPRPGFLVIPAQAGISSARCW
jgi:hypothetical protein